MTKANKITRQIPALDILDRPVTRGTQAEPTALYLLKLRSRHAATQSSVPRRRLVVKVEVGKGSDGLPKPIKITVA